MTEREKEKLLAYLLNELIRLESDMIDCQNRVRWRKPDEVDCLECMLAINRLKTFKDFSKAVMMLLALDDPKN